MARSLGVLAILALLLSMAVLQPADSACCYFTAKGKDIYQPAQKAFLSWQPQERLETLTVQPHFEGNALDFGVVFVTPAQPKVDAMPNDFFEELEVFTQLKHRDPLISKLLPQIISQRLANVRASTTRAGSGVKVLEAASVGLVNYKIITADQASDLFAWLKENKYNYAGDEATLDSYVRKKWFFTVMKIDTAQLKKNPDGNLSGEVAPMRFQFAADKLIYPLKIMRFSLKDKTDCLFYVQAPTKVDLPGDLTYQYQWIPMLQGAQGWYAKGTFGSHNLPGRGDTWLDACAVQTPALLKLAEDLGFEFVRGERPQPNPQGRIPTTLEWAKRLQAEDIRLLKGEAPYCEAVPDVDAGFNQADMQDANKAPGIRKVLHERLAQHRKERPGGYLMREAPPADLKQLKILVGHLKEGQFLTKFRKIFTKGEMEDDLLIVPSRVGQAQDESEYEEFLPTSPP
jgi:hypothetical protein